MSIDTERINRYLLEIKSRHWEISSLLAENTDEDLLRYWVISDSKLLSLVRENSLDFDAFIQAIRAYISTRAS
jgi:Uri superfamily endonuclease